MTTIPVSCFTQFSQSIKHYDLPSRFTFPFYYQAHPLCLLAAEEVQQGLIAPHSWQHNFGLGDDPHLIIGKMFGVLLVQNKQGEIGYLAAFSGKLAEQNHIEGFVPPVFDLLAKDSFFLKQQSNIQQLNQQIELLEQSPELSRLKLLLDQQVSTRDKHIAQLRAEMIEQRKVRKEQRSGAQTSLSPRDFTVLQQELNQQSIADKLKLKALSNEWDGRVKQAQQAFDAINNQLINLKLQRKQDSAALQQEIFAQYQFLNQQGQSKNLQDIFSQTALRTPPAGAGECAAPKLLQYAFKNQLKPLAMAEFWWGASPKSEVRQHKQFYPACLGKCQPILAHMLAGMALDENPMLVNQAAGKTLEIIYQDEHMLVVNKPAEFLSVPGKDIEDSVYARIKSQFPKASGSLIVHRLDMSTSGLMVIALNSAAHKNLQRQFIQRKVKKSYVALVEGLVPEETGTINLPLRGDLYDRPRQLVCEQHGKTATTYWQVIQRNHGTQQTKLLLQPHTGRTHQLRVHCAHTLGLNMPIVGDDLYGKVGERLHLQAQRLALFHPVSQQWLEFTAEHEF